MKNFTDFINENKNPYFGTEPIKDNCPPGVVEMRDGLTYEQIKKDFPWFLKAKVSHMIIGRGPTHYFPGDNSGHTKLPDYLIVYKGIWHNGTWEFGEFRGTWENGIWKNGNLAVCLWKDGIFQNGTAGNVSWQSGTWKKGIWKGGKDAEFLSGTWESGTWKQGKFGGGALPPKNKPAEWLDGTWQSGQFMGGRWHNGTWLGGIFGGFAEWLNGTWKSGMWNAKGIHPKER